MARAQTMSQVASAQVTCTTAGGEGLSLQLVEVQRCLRPGQFVSFANDDITPTSPRVHLVAQASARDALQAAAAVVPLAINSGFRPLSDQYLLWASGNCSVVATPGSSNHQSGRAVDVSNTVEARSALSNAGCVWFGASDAVHYDCPGMDLRADTVLTFQRLWNINNPGMPLAEDGDWGPMTLAALQASPAAGFALGGLSACGPCPGGDALNACGQCGAPPLEVCDGSDNDCDGMFDEGCDSPDAGVPSDAGVGLDGGAPADAGGGLDGGDGLDQGLTDGGLGDAAFPPGDGGDARADLGAGRPSSGCSVATRAHPPRSPGWGWLALGLAALGLGSERVRRRELRRGARRSTLSP